MFTCVWLAILLVVGSVLNHPPWLNASAARLGYYEGGTVFWEARNPDNPREITIDFEFNFDSRKHSSTHYQCTEDDIATQKKLRTGGQFRVGDAQPLWADYYCTHLDRRRHAATGVYRMTYTLPSNEATAEISYTECCWIPGIVNNGRDIGNGKGWNLASTININHKDGVSINSPPQGKTFAKYSIMSGCTYSIHIPHDDANNDIVKCRWTSRRKGECNPNALDICGTPYFDEERIKPVASLDKGSCELSFGEVETIPAGTYAFMVMLEDFAPGRSRKPMSKTPVHFLMNVFDYEGECRQPILHVPRICFAHVLGEEFQIKMVATATAPYHRITSIDVQGYPTDTPRRVPGTSADYEITFRFTPTELKTYTICAMASEDQRFISTQSCFTVKVMRTEPAVLGVDRANSIPAKGSQEAEAVVPKWAIKFKRNIQKGVFSPAYVTLRDSNDVVVWRVDATGPNVEVVNGDTLTFPNSHHVFLEYEAEYTISLDEGVVQSNDRKCSVKSKPAEWSFVTKLPAPALNEPECSISSMRFYIPKALVDLGGHGPEIMHLRDPQCTGANYNETHYVFWTSYDLCGTTFERNGTDYTYGNTVYIPDEPYRPVGTEVTRAPHEEIRFTCSIPAKTIKTLPYNPSPGITGYQMFNGRADFLDTLEDTTLRLFNSRFDQPYVEAAPPLDVAFNNRLYFEGEAMCSSYRNCDAFFQSCWATTSENPYNWPRHELVKAGCKEDWTLQIHNSGASNKVRFSVDAFAFLGWRIHDTVFVHCNVFVCPSNDYSSICKRGCVNPSSTISKRAGSRDVMSVVSSPGLYWQE
ncbi:uncharacterized protein LOC110973022 [Acanthaster planci]|uniref:Uncharacterized protein LOC110973022 n=1 Tax=Acanthaster planci TaxID=133434 RepID=A0A8B7XFQ0_ACAPL|nr:uncharacterized protein LOC110973022 [Acanthaster planci]